MGAVLLRLSLSPANDDDDESETVPNCCNRLFRFVSLLLLMFRCFPMLDRSSSVSQACGIDCLWDRPYSPLVGSVDLFSFFAEVCFFQFLLGRPRTNLVGRLSVRSLLMLMLLIDPLLLLLLLLLIRNYEDPDHPTAAAAATVSKAKRIRVTPLLTASTRLH